MSSYWVGDDVGRVLGPVSLQVIRDLVARGRLQRLKRASRDGTHWLAIEAVPELAEVVAPKTAAAPPKPPAFSFATEEARAEAEVTRLTGLLPAEALGLSPRATATDARQAFFAKVRLYHPSQLVPGSSESLRQSYARINELYSAALSLFRPEPAGGGAVSREPFGGWRKAADQTIYVELNVTADRASMFTDAPGANIANGGFFLPSDKMLPIFQMVEVKLHFQMPTRDITGAGRILGEVSVANKRGLAVRMLALSAEDKRFIEYFVRRTQAPG